VMLSVCVCVSLSVRPPFIGYQSDFVQIKTSLKLKHMFITNFSVLENIE
jgi:hypothetical protein